MTPEAKAREIALLPCPFCGGDASLRDGGPGCKFVQCDTCNTTSDDGSVERVSSAWNKRSNAQAILASEGLTQ